MKSDIAIAQSAHPLPIGEVAKELGIPQEDVIFYGDTKAKIRLDALNKAPHNPRQAKLILVTAMNPTPAGEGKTTVTIGLADALRRLNKKAVLALREPSMGPVFGIKGGAAGGGYAQVIPMEDINLHFTGDFHAVGAANNLLAAMIDNHIQQGNELNIDPRRITWRRVVDMNDRQLRSIVDGLGGALNGTPREDGFDITVASEIMAIMALATSLSDLKERLSRIVIGYTYDKRPVTAGDLRAQGAMTALLRDALMPNLVQTLEGTPAFVHMGPFANIAHGCNSLIADYMALSYGDYALTEAGFGADLGAEKFLDIAARAGGLAPRAAVVVATIRSMKYNGGIAQKELTQENLEALRKGSNNLMRHLHNMRDVYGIPVVAALNIFSSDTSKEIELVQELVEREGFACIPTRVWEQGGEGARSLAETVLQYTEDACAYTPCYPAHTPLEEAIASVARRVYHADGVSYTARAKRQIHELIDLGYAELPVCIAKTQYSLSDDPHCLGAPEHFTLTVREARLAAGAGFVVVLTGNIMTMPGLPKEPAALHIDVDESGVISGLF